MDDVCPCTDIHMSYTEIIANVTLPGNMSVTGAHFLGGSTLLRVIRTYNLTSSPHRAKSALHNDITISLSQFQQVGCFFQIWSHIHACTFGHPTCMYTCIIMYKYEIIHVQVFVYHKS